VDNLDKVDVMFCVLSQRRFGILYAVEVTSLKVVLLQFYLVAHNAVRTDCGDGCYTSVWHM
jgi:hypothetical protein